MTFLGVLEYTDVLGGARCITVVGDHLRGEVDNTKYINILKDSQKKSQLAQHPISDVTLVAITTKSIL